MFKYPETRNGSNWSLYGGFLVDIAKIILNALGRMMGHIAVGGITGALVGGGVALFYGGPLSLGVIVGGVIGIIIVFAIYVFISTLH